VKQRLEQVIGLAQRLTLPSAQAIVSRHECGEMLLIFKWWQWDRCGSQLRHID
jgi:hypothetical protein